MRVNHVYEGESLEILKTFPDECIDMCITSPPYYGLRDYGVDGQLGLEESPEIYINRLCTIFDEVRRVLKDSGTCWVNISDSYGSPASKNINKGSNFHGGKSQHRNVAFNFNSSQPKSLLGIPERFVLEMQNRGWIRRNTIIWHKPNCMPSSVKDRFTVDFEYVYFFSKKPRYYFEQQHEDALESSQKRYEYGLRSVYGDKEKYGGKESNSMCDCERMGDFVSNPTKRNMRTVWKITTKPYKAAHFAVFPEDLIETPIKAGCPTDGVVLDPFMGSGTTAAVSKRLGRNYVGIELNPDYHALINERLNNTVRIKPLDSFMGG